MHKTNKVRIGRIALLTVLLLCAVAIGCPIYESCGILCPCCGVTRAWVSLFRGDIMLAFRYHALFPVIPVIGVLYVYDGCNAKSPSKWLTIVMDSLALAVFIYGALRWFGYVVIP